MSPLSLRRSALAFFAIIAPAVLAAGAQTAQQIQPWKSLHFSIAPKALYDAASAVAAPDTADVALLEDDESYSFDASGRNVHTQYVVYRILTQKGAEMWDSGAVDWEPWHQARPSIKVRVIAPDLSVHWLDPKSITEAPAREGEYKTYGDGKMLRAPFPAIEPGVVVEEEFITAETVPFFAPGHVGRVWFGREGVPVAHSLAVFDAPSSLPLRTQTISLPNLKPQRTEANGRVTLTYDPGPLDGFDSRIADLPPDLSPYPAVAISTGASWQQMAIEYAKIVDSHTDRDAVQPIVDSLIAGKTTAAAKEAAILEYVDREIRYTGIEFDEAAIVPHAPSEVLAKKYGDCKDKATLIVAMLRAAGIPANVALLNAGSRLDVPADLPGMGLFDHAIVYLPGTPALWIDATDVFDRLGQLPAGDQGRYALIASPSTTALVKTPESTSKQNVQLELRTIALGENGPATVTEITRPMGVFEGEYRSAYADKPDKDMRENLSGYVKSQYLSDKLTKVDRTDPSDLSTQFDLTLTCEKAKRGYTDLDSAVAAIRLEGLFARLPQGMTEKDNSSEKKSDDKDKPKKPRTFDWYLNAPFSSEWRYKIISPAGFVAKELPKDAKLSIGPATLTEQFSTDKDGAVLAHLVFDTVKQRFTADEARQMGSAIADLVKGPAILINFEPQGEALLHEGKVKEALATYRALVALHPNDAVPHLQVAKVLLEAGMGEAARAEARQAVKLDPSSALAEKTLAEILKHDLVGRNLRAGSDLDGAAEAYRAAIKLDPDDHSTEGDLANLLEYDPAGRCYGRLSKIKEAVAVYQKLGQDKLDELGLGSYLAFALFYDGDYAEALKAAQTLNPEPKSLIAASEAMINGSKAGLAEINKRSTSDDAFKETARAAGEMLMNSRQYAQAADFLEAGASGDSAAQTMGQAAMLRTAQRHEDMHFANTPADLVKQAIIIGVDPALTQAKLDAVSSRNARIVMKNEDADEQKKTLEGGKKLNSQMARQDESLDVWTDMMLSAVDPKGEGNDANGYRESIQIPGGANLTFFVIKEDGLYKLLDSTEHPNAIGLEILDRIKAGKLAEAKALLDWLREDSHLEGGDDPLGGPVFPRFWIKGQTADAHKMKLAAAAILVTSKPTAAQGVAILEEARKTAVSAREKTNLLIALTAAYDLQQNFAKLLEASSELLKQEPTSKLAFLENSQALMGLGRYDAALALGAQRLKLLDGDEDALTMKMEIEADRGNFALARATAQKLIDQGKENAGLLNNIAWYALFTGKITDADISMAIKSTQLAKDNPGILHTLACLYAASGKATEARDLLLRAMDELDLDAPDDNYWYAFGLVAEQFGEREIAIADYRKLEKPKEKLQLPTSSYTLAQMRLKALGAPPAAAPSK